MRETTSAIKERIRARQQTIPKLEILNITFDNNDPCKPQYKSLFRPPHTAGLEPVFQVDPSITQVAVTVHLEDSGVVLADDPDEKRAGLPLCRVLNEPHSADFPKIIHEGTSRTSCTLTWERPAVDPSRPRVYRIYCKPKEGEHTDEQKVHGGLFLTFVSADVGTMKVGPVLQNAGNWDRRKIHLIGIDSLHRPIYDLHLNVDDPSRYKFKIELEPAYRVRLKETLSFRLILHLQNAIWGPDIEFSTLPHWPEELYYEHQSPTHLYFSWKDTGEGQITQKDRETAKITSFRAMPKILPGGKMHLPPNYTVDQYQQALSRVGVDPTIIQPPTCDPVYNVCSPDHEYGPTKTQSGR